MKKRIAKSTGRFITSALFARRRALVYLLALAFVGLPMLEHVAEAHPLTAVRPRRTIETITVKFRGVDRPVSLYVPTGYQPGTPVPLVFALHGGSGDASVMYDPAKRIVEYAENEGFIAVFPNGLPSPDAPPDSTNYYWSDPVNIPYMDHLIDLMTATYTIDERRVYFVGFSGGAKLIYNLAADPAISARIAAIATVAGEFGGKRTVPPDSPWEIIDPIASGGVPMSALLLQGGKDKRCPEKGGFEEDFEKIATSFQVKVDSWRLFIGAGTGSSVTLPGAPSRVQAMSYVNPTTGHTVISVVDPKIAHVWPEYSMDVFWDFFERVPTR